MYRLLHFQKIMIIIPKRGSGIALLSSQNKSINKTLKATIIPIPLDWFQKNWQNNLTILHKLLLTDNVRLEFQAKSLQGVIFWRNWRNQGLNVATSGRFLPVLSDGESHCLIISNNLLWFVKFFACLNYVFDKESGDIFFFCFLSGNDNTEPIYISWHQSFLLDQDFEDIFKKCWNTNFRITKGEKYYRYDRRY
jgi:hypothetical protein